MTMHVHLLSYRYDLSQVEVVEAVAAEGLATFGGCLADASKRQLEELLLAALRNGLGYRGETSSITYTESKPKIVVSSMLARLACQLRLCLQIDHYSSSCTAPHSPLFTETASSNCPQEPQNHTHWTYMFPCYCLAAAAAAGGLPAGQLFSSLTASPEARLAAAAAGAAMPLWRLSADDAAGLMAGVLRSFSREVADTPLLLVPQVRFRHPNGG
jgi:hypothetical protein